MDERELRLYEEQVRRAVSADLRSSLDQLLATASAIYVSAAGDTRHALGVLAQNTMRDVLSDTLMRLEHQDYSYIRRTLQGAAREMLEAGADGVEVRGTTPLDIRAAMIRMADGMRGDLREARTLARHGSMARYGDIVATIQQAKNALNRADSSASWIVHRAHNEGARRAVERQWSRGEDDLLLMWRAERNACPTCLGFAGALARPGELFEPVFVVADESALTGPLPGPPAHPRCRCRAERWRGDPDNLRPVDLPHALRREAQRSVVQGVASGGRLARLRAADRLLQMGGLLIPKSVQKRAKQAVSSGDF